MKSEKDKEIIKQKNRLIENLKNNFSIENITTTIDEWAKNSKEKFIQ